METQRSGDQDASEAGEVPDESGHARVQSAVLDAFDTRLATVEASFTRGFAGVQLIGNTSEVSRDAKERAKTALEALGIHLPPRRLVISLTPADLKMDGSQFDLPIAVSLALLVSPEPPAKRSERWLFAAELGLSGELRPVRGTVPFALAAITGGLDGVVVARQSVKDVRILTQLSERVEKPLEVAGFSHLGEVLEWLGAGVGKGAWGAPVVAPASAADEETLVPTQVPDFDDMLVAPSLEKAALVTGAGMHSLLLRGPPGTGKSMFAARLGSILPPLEREEQCDAMRIYSTCYQKIPAALLSGRPPYRAPHHQASSTAVLGSPDHPGELALAHGGLLFLDELPEFRRDLLEALREPLETGEVRVSRAKRKITWKARVILVAACNNCPCGWFASRRRDCRCGTGRLHSYWRRISGPILDRIDLHVNMPEQDDNSAELLLKLAESDGASRTQRMAAQVRAARERAARRNAPFGVLFNCDLPPNKLLAASGLPQARFERCLEGTVPKTAGSRAVIRALRVARTLADLEAREVIEVGDLRQAWQWQAEPAAKARGEHFYEG